MYDLLSATAPFDLTYLHKLHCKNWHMDKQEQHEIFYCYSQYKYAILGTTKYTYIRLQ